MKVGELVGSQALVNAYDRYFAQVLGDRIEAKRGEKKGERTKYKIVKALPDKDEYSKLKQKEFSVTVEQLVDDAYNIAEELGNEMREVYDNMPENLQEGDLGQRRSEAADNCENIAGNKPEVPAAGCAITVMYLPSLDTSSRAKRASEGASMMQCAAEAIREHLEDLPEDGDEGEDDADLESLADQLENDASEFEGIEFPGMYG